MSSVGGLTRYPVDYRPAFASSLIPSPLPRRLPLQSAFPRGEATGLLRSSRRSLRGRAVPFGRWRVIRGGGHCNPRTWPRTFWSEPDSILGSTLLTGFISTSPGLTRPGLLAPDRRDAGSRRVGSRVHGRSFGWPNPGEAVMSRHLGTFPKTMLGGGRQMERKPAFRRARRR